MDDEESESQVTRPKYERCEQGNSREKKGKKESFLAGLLQVFLEVLLLAPKKRKEERSYPGLDTWRKISAGESKERGEVKFHGHALCFEDVYEVFAYGYGIQRGRSRRDVKDVTGTERRVTSPFDCSAVILGREERYDERKVGIFGERFKMR